LNRNSGGAVVVVVVVGADRPAGREIVVAGGCGRTATQTK